MAPVVAAHGGLGMVVYDRGAIIERYVARSQSIEQQFVIPADPRQAEIS